MIIAKQIEELRGIHAALKNGEANWSDYCKEEEKKAAADFLGADQNE